MLEFDATAAWNLAIALLGGMAVGIERQWSGHAVGPAARFAGLRTFTMLGLVAGLSGWLWTSGLEGPALVLLAGSGALVVVAYAAASRSDVDGTTEVAAFVVLAAGALSGAGVPAVASGIVAVTLILLVEKKGLHGLVTRLDRVELRAAARFAVMATVILPLLPAEAIGPWGGIRARQLWALVLFFSGLSFLGYFARRVAGPERGYTIAGTVGGLLSSTAVTLTFARLSGSVSGVERALAAGTLGANVMLFPRVLLATVVLAPPVAAHLWPAFVAPVLVGTLLVLRGLPQPSSASPRTLPPETNPLKVSQAVQMALFFQVVLFAVWGATRWFGEEGLIGSAAVLGLADVDALTVSMAHASTTGTASSVAATAITVGVLSNTLVKMSIALLVGVGRFRWMAASGLGLMAVTLAAALAWH